MSRPRILLVPSLSELEWTIRPLLEEWAEVASYDGPGVGDEPAAAGLRTVATAERGLAELERLGWDRCVVAGDEFGAVAAILLAAGRPSVVQGLALGHPIASASRAGERPALSPGVTDALVQLAEVDFRTFVRNDFRSQHGRSDPSLPAPGPDKLAKRYLERVSQQTAVDFYRELAEHADELHARATEALKGLDVPLLLVKHERCVMFTSEGYEDAVAAFPEAHTGATQAKPTVDPEFAGILREFCEQIAREAVPDGG